MAIEELAQQLAEKILKEDDPYRKHSIYVAREWNEDDMLALSLQQFNEAEWKEIVEIGRGDLPPDSEFKKLINDPSDYCYFDRSVSVTEVIKEAIDHCILD